MTQENSNIRPAPANSTVVAPADIESRLPSRRPVRAMQLLSGGLDSQLAVCVLREQGVEVHAIIFQSPFFSAAKGQKAAAQLGIQFVIEDFTATIIKLLCHSSHGFGTGLNPCIDCHIAMIRHAGRIMHERDFDFISTGEVLNQRPMSQNRQALQIVAEESGLPDLLLRPLSAQLLPATRPEQAGLVDRARLLNLQGRNRKPQIALAKQYRLTDYPQPAGGCLLTEKLYGKKLRDLRDHEGLNDTDIVKDIKRLNLGRHFRLSDCRLIVGRNHAENIFFESDIRPGELIIKPLDFPGATGLLASGATDTVIRLATEVCARYSDCAADSKTRMLITSGLGSKNILSVRPANPDNVEHYRIT